MSGKAPVIRGCEFKFKCKKTWDGLETLENYPKGIRYCSTCMRDVYLVTTDLELKKAVLDNQCVAIPLKMQISVIEESALKKLKEGHMVGSVCFSELPPNPLKGVWP